MLKRYTEDDVSSINLMKSSAQRSIRSKVLLQFPLLEHVIDDILPRKVQLLAAKCPNHVTLVLNDSKEALFFQSRDGPWIPSLRLVHKYPHMMHKMQIDRGAIRFVLRGSNVMCPGLTSSGGKMESVERNDVVQITGEGKENACAVGIMTMSTGEIKETKTGVGIETCHYLNDGLWKNPVLHK